MFSETFETKKKQNENGIEGEEETCCWRATCSLSLVACFLIASIQFNLIQKRELNRTRNQLNRFIESHARF